MSYKRADCTVEDEEGIDKQALEGASQKDGREQSRPLGAATTTEHTYGHLRAECFASCGRESKGWQERGKIIFVRTVLFCIFANQNNTIITAIWQKTR